MPNGGSDCCATCWHDSANDGEAKYQDDSITGSIECILRDLEVPEPYGTYCANHPQHCFERIDVPIGPVYVLEIIDESYARRVWVEPPVNETIRQKLLELLGRIITKDKTMGYPSPGNTEFEVIRQLIYLKEKRALPHLLDLVRRDISDYVTPPIHIRTEQVFSIHIRNKLDFLGRAVEALLNISDGEFLPEAAPMITLGITEPYDLDADMLAIIRYSLVLGLEFCPQAEADALLQQATQDPNSEVRQEAERIIGKRRSSS